MQIRWKPWPGIWNKQTHPQTHTFGFNIYVCVCVCVCIYIYIYITACTVVKTVVKATSKSNGKGQILTPWGSETPERISMKLGIYNRVAGMTTYSNPCGAATTWEVWANTWKNTCCGFLGIPFFYFILRLAPCAHTWSDFDDLYIIRRVSAHGCAFWGLVHTAPHFGKNPPKTPIFGAWIGIFKLNVQNIKICILSKFLHQLPPNFA